MCWMPRIMRKFSRSIAVLALLAAACFPGQSRSKTLDAFIQKVSSSLVTFEYSFTCNVNGTKMTGSGDVKLQDDSFHVTGNGLDIWCDGKTRWTVDTFSEEAVIEPVEKGEDSYMVNPALLISAVDDAFTEASSGSASFSGNAVDSSVLTPLKKGKSASDISKITLYFKKGSSSLAGVEVRLNDGTVSVFTLKNFRFDQKQKESFRFDEKTLDSSYVVTDLR